jgi:NADPH-dependent glutamate synthase beta subunit-like oxidoreductase
MDKAIDIKGLQAYASQAHLLHPLPEGEGNTVEGRVAIVGAGPAGITAAFYLSAMGIEVDVFECEEFPGGLMTYGIRPDKVNKMGVLHEIGHLLNHPRLSLHFKARVSDPRDLLRDHRAVYVATGLSAEKVDERAARFKNVYGATAFLKEVNKAHLKGRVLKRLLGKDVLVIGGGNTAMDAAITACRSGASNVTIVYRRTENEMPAWEHERAEARKQGAHLRFLLEPTSFRRKDGKIASVIFRPMKLGRPGPDGRKKVFPDTGPNVSMEASSLIFATGRDRVTPGWLENDKIDPESGRLGRRALWVGGELRRGVGLIVQAVADGKRAAQEIVDQLKGK